MQRIAGRAVSVASRKERVIGDRMSIVAKKESIIPPGQYTGEIVKAELGTITFDQDEGPKDQVLLQIQADYEPEDGSNVRAMQVNFSPSLNGLSKLSRFLDRLGLHPPDGVAWEPSNLVGTRVAFTAQQNGDFVNVDRDSLRLPDVESDKDSDEDSGE